MLSIDEQWFREVEEVSEYVTLMDADDRLLYVNHTQAGVEVAPGKSAFDYVDPNYHDRLRAAVDSARGSKLPQHFVSNAVGPNGESAIYSNWVFPVLADDPSGIVAFVSTDVTHQGRVEAALELSEVTFQSLVKSSPDNILVVDRQRNVVFVNRDEWGIGLENVIGRPADAFVPEGDREAVIQCIEYVLQTGKAAQYELELENPQGEIQRFSTRANPICVDGEISRVMLVATDVTEAHRAAEERDQLVTQLHQAQKMESLGKLTGGVAHDFNNLLTAISANCEMTRRMPGLPEQVADYMDQSLEAVGLAKRLTEQLLAFSRKQALRPETIDLGKSVFEMQPLLQSTLGVTIQVNVVIDPGHHVSTVDANQFESSLLNLAVNAKDAMPNGGTLKIRCSTVQVGDINEGVQLPGSYVRIVVEDNGCGMEPEVAARSMEPFFSTKAVGGGSGLGLSMVYGFVRQSAGHVRIMSQPEVGTIVEIDLPKAAEESTSAGQLSDPTDLSQGSGEMVLVVEDDNLVRNSIKAILQILGYRSCLAENASRALELLDNESEIAFVLSDVVLRGGMDGFELAKQARLKRPDLVFIFASGYPDAALKMSAEPIIDTILNKPFSMDELSQAIQEAQQIEKQH